MKRGFTIIEMLAIIVILAIMLVLVLPNLIGISDKNKQTKYEQLVSNIKLAAETYINNEYNNPTYPVQIQLQTLIDAGYLDEPLTNPLTKEVLDYTTNVLATQNADNSITYTYPDTSDIGNPVVVFGTNGSLVTVSSVSTTVTVTDDTGLNTSSLKYLWTTSKNAPNEASFSTTFTNGATLTTPSAVTGTYYLWILAKDTTGNTTIKNSNPFKLKKPDTTAPTVVFGINGNSTYAKTRSTTVTATDDESLNTSSLKYQWTTSSTAPTEASFSTPFTNGAIVNTPTGVTGSYYLWILAKDTVGNTTIIKSNLFNLDNTAPVITMNGNNPVTIATGSTYTDAGATAIDNINGSVTVTATSTVVPTVSGSYTVTYSANDTSGNMATTVVRNVMVITAITNFGYTGAVQTYSVPATGYYTLQVWGAQGGFADSTGGVGGVGGYSSGTIHLNSGTILYIYVGGAGSYGTTADYDLVTSGGYNGGGGAYYYGGTGGGGTDIRIGTDSLYYRAIVAGGGGGAQGRYGTAYTANGGVGGGINGGAGGYTSAANEYCSGYGGTQTAGGAAGYFRDTAFPGSFGQGGASSHYVNSTTKSPGGGGGGWYGGGGGTYRYSSGGGGSGYVYISTATVVSGYGLTSTYYLTNTSLIAGDSSMPSVSGGTEIGHSGNGYTRITFIST